MCCDCNILLFQCSLRWHPCVKERSESHILHEAALACCGHFDIHNWLVSIKPIDVWHKTPLHSSVDRAADHAATVHNCFVFAGQAQTVQCVTVHFRFFANQQLAPSARARCAQNPAATASRPRSPLQTLQKHRSGNQQ